MKSHTAIAPPHRGGAVGRRCEYGVRSVVEFDIIDLLLVRLQRILDLLRSNAEAVIRRGIQHEPVHHIKSNSKNAPTLPVDRLKTIALPSAPPVTVCTPILISTLLWWTQSRSGNYQIFSYGMEIQACDAGLLCVV